GRLSTVLGRFEEAEAHFDAALAVDERMGAVTNATAVRYAYGDMLLRRNGPGDRERAREHLEEALSTAREIGLNLLVRKIEELGAPGRPAAAAIAGESVFRREGEFWTVGFGDAMFRLKDTKGMRHLAALLARPGIEVHVMELVAASSGGGVDDERAIRREIADGALVVSDGVGDDVLDKRARAEYRRRLEALGDELEKAERNNDTERSAPAKREMHQVTDPLPAALGLGRVPRDFTPL